MIPYKVFYPLAGALSTFALGVILIMAKVPLWGAIGGTVALALLTIALTERLVHVADVFINWSVDARTIAFRLIAVATLADAATVVMFVVYGLAAIPAVLLYLLLLAAFQVLVAFVAESYLARIRPRLVEARKVRELELRKARETREITLRGTSALERYGNNDEEPEEDQNVLKMRKALKSIGLGWLIIKNPQHLNDGKANFGIRFDAQITAKAISSSKNRTFGVEHGEAIAVALSEMLGQELETRWIGIQKLKRAGGYSITVTIEDVMARIYPFEDVLEWADIQEPAPIGFGLDAKMATLLLRQHGQFIGMTRSGKSSLINCVIAYLTRCRNAVVWFCGTEKLYDILAEWLEVYEDKDEDMPFDWIMSGPQDTAEMLAALMRVGRYRQSLKKSLREGMPDIVCILDEAMFALSNTKVTAHFDGQDMMMSALARNITQGIGSAGCHLVLSTQRDTNDQYGPYGGDIAAQMGYTAAFGTQDGLSVGRLLGDFKLPPPEHKGEFLLKDNAGGRFYPERLKGQYVQEIDPGKPKLHNGATVAEVSWSRRKFPRKLDVGSQRSAGQTYLNRPTRVTEEFLNYLRNPSGNAAPKGSADTPTVDEFIDHLMDAGRAENAELIEDAVELAKGMGLDYHTLPEADKEAFRIAAAEIGKDDDGEDEKKVEPEAPSGLTRADQVVWVLRQAGHALSSADILNAIKSAGFEVKNDGSVYNLLGKLVTDGILTKNEDRLFGLPGW